MFQQPVALVVAVENGRAARNNAFENFRLCVGDLVKVFEDAQMRGGNDRDDGHMRLHEADEIADFARMIHPDLEHAILRVLRHLRHASAARPSDC